MLYLIRDTGGQKNWRILVADEISQIEHVKRLGDRPAYFRFILKNMQRADLTASEMHVCIDHEDAIDELKKKIKDETKRTC